MAGLFRDEVLDVQCGQGLGTIRIGRNPSFVVVTVVALVLATALVAFAFWGEVARKERLSGALGPVEATFNLPAPPVGTVLDVRLPALVPGSADGRPSPLEAQLYAPIRTARSVHAGQVVWLRYAAYPYQTFGMARGEVTSVSRTPTPSTDLPAGQASSTRVAGSEPMYRVTVALAAQSIRAYGEVRPLQAGMALEADVVRERRRVWEWLLEPVLAASGLGKSPAPPSP